MSAEIIDLVASGVVAVPKTVRLPSGDYRLPGDIPAPLYVLILEAQERGEDDPEVARRLYEELLAAFRIYHPDLDRLPLGLNEMTSVIGAVYASGASRAQAADDDAVPPPTPAKSRRRNSSRSST